MSIIGFILRAPYVVFPAIVYVVLLVTAALPQSKFCKEDDAFNNSQYCKSYLDREVGSIQDAWFDAPVVTIGGFDGVSRFIISVGSFFQLAVTVCVFMEGVRLQYYGPSSVRFAVSVAVFCLFLYLFFFVTGYFTKVFFAIVGGSSANVLSPILHLYWASYSQKTRRPSSVRLG